MTDICRSCTEHTFSSHDGTALFYRHWRALSGGESRKAIILFHRGHEHGGRLAHLVDELALPGHAFFAWDARGLGKSAGERGYADDFGVLVKDADVFVRHVSETWGIAMEQIAVIAQSVGAVVVSAWVHDYAPPIRAMVLASPAFKVKLYVPFARTGLALMRMVRNKFFVNSYVKAGYLTHDEARIASYKSDPLIVRPIAVNILLELYEVAERVAEDAAAIHVPTQLLISGSDWVVHRKPQQEFFKRLGSTRKEVHILKGFHHDTLGEKDRHLALAKTRDFLVNQWASPVARPNLNDADRQGYTRDEFDRLSKTPAALAARIYWLLSRLCIRLGGKLSDGIRLGIETGFDSGSTLDYVYRNLSSGRKGIGQLVDRIYLDSIGWRGIRVRKNHLVKMIGTAVDRLEVASRPVRILDLAAGHGRYVLEALAARATQPESILMRDYSRINVAAGRKLIEEAGLQHCAQFAEADAFDRDSVAAVRPRPTLVVVSGLYELFPENALIRTSLAGVADALESGGFLVYTNQPWHPQLELIARCLTSHCGGKPWIMRRRTQMEMDQLVESAGFEKIDQLSDQWGIFSVSLARKK